MSRDDGEPRRRAAAPFALRAGPVLAGVTLAGAALAAQMAGGAWPVALGLACFIAGLAHGAGDESEGGIAPLGPIHALAYLAIGGAVAALFLAAPLAGLALFLTLSAWHFARSDCAMEALARAAMAALAVGGSALFQPAGTGAVFAVILGAPVPPPVLATLAVVGAVGTVLALVTLVRAISGRTRHGGAEAAAALAATALLSPVLAVGLVFLIGHALPVQRGQIARHGGAAVLRAVLVPTLIAVTGAALLMAGVLTGVVPLALAVALAFGLATPHMLTERLER